MVQKLGFSKKLGFYPTFRTLELRFKEFSSCLEIVQINRVSPRNSVYGGYLALIFDMSQEF